MIELLNVQEHETVHQRCILVKGLCNQLQQRSFTLNNEVLLVETHDVVGKTIFPQQSWPIAQGHFKALLMLTPGLNVVSFRNKHEELKVLRLNYVALTHLPPLHLAIMVAKDSPLLIDCPPAKRISSTHSNLDAATAKLRMTAYMWQAFTAEDMRQKGLGRRSFRLEEEWTVDTVSQSFIQSSYDDSMESAMGTTAKVHIIPTEKTVAEIRNTVASQQSQSGGSKQNPDEIFEEALQRYGGPFTSSARPVIAGMILDSHYSMERNYILGNTHGRQKQELSLGVTASHLAYSFPRFIEEIPECLLDRTHPGDTVCNESGECNALWEACSVGQAGFLHQVGHAFGAEHTTGIMDWCYSDWPKAFLPFVSTRSEEGEMLITANTIHEATWDLQDALKFSCLPHFRLPDDPETNPLYLTEEPVISVVGDDEDFLQLAITHSMGLVCINFGCEEPEPHTSMDSLKTKVVYNLLDLEQRFDRALDLNISVLGRNGKARSLSNVWRLFASREHVNIPGTCTKMFRKSVQSETLEHMLDGGSRTRHKHWNWAVLLSQRDPNGELSRAYKIDLRVGCVLDGAVVYFDNGRSIPCGPRFDQNGRKFSFGGHASKMLHIPKGVEIVKVEVNAHSELAGIRMYLSNGKAIGELNARNKHKITTLEPDTGFKIVGFYGCHGFPRGYAQQFGILTWPKDQDLPTEVYEMSELKNTDGGISRKHPFDDECAEVAEVSDAGENEDYDESDEDDAE